MEDMIKVKAWLIIHAHQIVIPKKDEQQERQLSPDDLLKVDVCPGWTLTEQGIAIPHRFLTAMALNGRFMQGGSEIADVHTLYALHLFQFFALLGWRKRNRLEDATSLMNTHPLHIRPCTTIPYWRDVQHSVQMLSKDSAKYGWLGKKLKHISLDALYDFGVSMCNREIAVFGRYMTGKTTLLNVLLNTCSFSHSSYGFAQRLRVCSSAAFLDLVDQLDDSFLHSSGFLISDIIHHLHRDEDTLHAFCRRFNIHLQQSDTKATLLPHIEFDMPMSILPISNDNRSNGVDVPYIVKDGAIFQVVVKYKPLEFIAQQVAQWATVLRDLLKPATRSDMKQYLVGTKTPETPELCHMQACYRACISTPKDVKHVTTPQMRQLLTNQITQPLTCLRSDVLTHCSGATIFSGRGLKDDFDTDRQYIAAVLAAIQSRNLADLGIPCANIIASITIYVPKELPGTIYELHYHTEMQDAFMEKQLQNTLDRVHTVICPFKESALLSYSTFERLKNPFIDKLTVDPKSYRLICIPNVEYMPVKQRNNKIPLEDLEAFLTDRSYAQLLAQEEVQLQCAADALKRILTSYPSPPACFDDLTEEDKAMLMDNDGEWGPPVHVLVQPIDPFVLRTTSLSQLVTDNAVQLITWYPMLDASVRLADTDAMVTKFQLTTQDDIELLLKRCRGRLLPELLMGNDFHLTDPPLFRDLQVHIERDIKALKCKGIRQLTTDGRQAVTQAFDTITNDAKFADLLLRVGTHTVATRAFHSHLSDVSTLVAEFVGMWEQTFTTIRQSIKDLIPTGATDFSQYTTHMLSITDMVWDHLNIHKFIFAIQTLDSDLSKTYAGLAATSVRTELFSTPATLLTFNPNLKTVLKAAESMARQAMNLRPLPDLQESVDMLKQRWSSEVLAAVVRGYSAKRGDKRQDLTATILSKGLVKTTTAFITQVALEHFQQIRIYLWNSQPTYVRTMVQHVWVHYRHSLEMDMVATEKKYQEFISALRLRCNGIFSNICLVDPSEPLNHSAALTLREHLSSTMCAQRVVIHALKTASRIPPHDLWIRFYSSLGTRRTVISSTPAVTFTPSLRQSTGRRRLLLIDERALRTIRSALAGKLKGKLPPWTSTSLQRLQLQSDREKAPLCSELLALLLVLDTNYCNFEPVMYTCSAMAPLQTDPEVQRLTASLTSLGYNNPIELFDSDGVKMRALAEVDKKKEVVVVTDDTDVEIALCASADLLVSVHIMSSSDWAKCITTAWKTGNLTVHTRDLVKTRLFDSSRKRKL